MLCPYLSLSCYSCNTLYTLSLQPDRKTDSFPRVIQFTASMTFKCVCSGMPFHSPSQPVLHHHLVILSFQTGQVSALRETLLCYKSALNPILCYLITTYTARNRSFYSTSLIYLDFTMIKQMKL